MLKTKRAKGRPSRPNTAAAGSHRSSLESSREKADTGLTHVDAKGRIRMVDVGAKAVTDREAVARWVITMSAEARQLIRAGALKKGDRANLEEEFGDPGELEREIRITVLHELGHYFGLDEERLADLGYE